MLKRFLAVFLAVVCLSGPALAATRVLDGNGKVIGATGVSVGSLGLFNVSFVEGSCVSLFDGCDSVDDFDFATVGEAVAAANYLLGQVFNGDLYDSPEAIFGCESTVVCRVLIPTLGPPDLLAFDLTAVGYAAINNNALNFAQGDLLTRSINSAGDPTLTIDGQGRPDATGSGMRMPRGC